MILKIALALLLLGSPTAPAIAQEGHLIPPHTQTGVSVDSRATTGDSSTYWKDAGRVTWYGYGLYGRRTACGQRLTTSLIGVAHRTLPCGTRVRFLWKGRIHTVPVVDRGPYPCGFGNSCSLNRVYRFDWTAGTARLFGGHFTRTGVKYHVIRR